MKRIISIFILILVLFGAFSFTAFAEETDMIETEPETAETTAEGEEFPSETIEPESEPQSSGTPRINHTIFSRLWEYLTENTKEVLTVVGDVLLAAVAIFIKIRSDRNTKDISEDVRSIKGESSDIHISQGSIVGVVNKMVDGYNGMRDVYDKNQYTEEARNKLVGALLIQTTAILEFLNTVYVHNKNLPQGVKDIVSLKYAKCLKALEDEEALAGIVDLVRERIGISDSEAQNTEPHKSDEPSEEA